MAKSNDSFYNLGFGSIPKVQEYSNVFKPIGELLSKPFEQSIEKTKKLMALMPNGIPIEKVPEQIRGQVTEFLANNKKIYADASRDLATALPGSDKYTNAMNTLNDVNNKFENLSASLETYQNNVKTSLETFEQLALSNDQNTKLDHSNMANGNVLNSFQIDENGYGTFLSSNGERIKFSDYNPGFVDDGAMITSFLELTDAAQKEGLLGINFDPIKYEAALKAMFKTGGIDRVINFAYDGVKTGNLLDDSQPMQFIHQYIESKTGKKPGDEGYEKLLEEYKKDDGLIDAFGDHLIGVLKDQYHNQGAQIRNAKTSTTTTEDAITTTKRDTPTTKKRDTPITKKIDTPPPTLKDLETDDKVVTSSFENYTGAYGDGETYLPSRAITLPIFDENGNPTGKTRRFDANQIQITFENGQPAIQYDPNDENSKFQLTRNETIDTYVKIYGKDRTAQEIKALRENIEKFVDEQIAGATTEADVNEPQGAYANITVLTPDTMAEETKEYQEELHGKLDNLLVKNTTVGDRKLSGGILLNYGDDDFVVNSLNKEFNDFGFEFKYEDLGMFESDAFRVSKTYKDDDNKERTFSYVIKFDTMYDDYENTQKLISLMQAMYTRDMRLADDIAAGIETPWKKEIDPSQIQTYDTKGTVRY